MLDRWVNTKRSGSTTPALNSYLGDPPKPFTPRPPNHRYIPYIFSFVWILKY